MNVRKNTFYNLAGSILPLAVTLIVTPIYVEIIGESRYGILALVWLLLGYFGIFDLGLGRATAQHMAAIPEASNSSNRADLFWTALFMNSCFGVVGGIIVWPAAILFFDYVTLAESPLQHELSSSIPWMAIAVPLATVTSVLNGALLGRAKFLRLNITSVGATTLAQLLPLAVAMRFGPNLSWLIATVVASRVLFIGVLFALCRSTVYENHPIKASRKVAKSLLKFGGWVSASSLIGPMMTILDRFVIGATLGARFVTYYTIPFQLGQRTVIVPDALSSALFPKLAVSDKDQRSKLASSSIRTLAVIMTPAMLLGILFLEPFLQVWMDKGFADQATLVGQILLIGFWVNGVAKIAHTELQATARPRVIALCHLFELPPYILMLYIGLNVFGLPGAAAAFSIRALGDCILLMFFSGNLTENTRFLVIPIAILCLALLLANHAYDESTTRWAIYAVTATITAAWSWKASPEDIKAYSRMFIRRLFS